MRRMLAVLFLLISSRSYAAFAVGDQAPNMCWYDASSRSVCLHDSAKNIRVLFYLNGHCPTCETLLDGLTARASKLEPDHVDFLALYTEGATEHASPDASFLAKSVHTLKAPAKGSLLILASPDDAGTAFYELPDVPRVPDVIVLDTDDTIVLISDTPTLDNVMTQLEALEPEPAATGGTPPAHSGSRTAVPSFSR